jgi:hypothetical protein
MARTCTAVKGRFVRPGSSRTTPAAFRASPGVGTRRQIGATLRYLETREPGAGEQPKDRALFGAFEDRVARQVVRDDLARWVTPDVAYYSLVLSPGPLGRAMNVERMRDWMQRVMAGPPAGCRRWRSANWRPGHAERLS